MILNVTPLCYKNVAKRVFVSEKMNILHSAISTTGIDWSRDSTKDAKGFL
ncbi:hypothetical protein HMPREF0208_04583 [Citrobacter koseri]|uniref:Uncharacterized protein n=1 Tax=Citrobacter koseri (strain ATCC BAA-895 / CDC 4225-83 / SGSC4696) TaxID=290338 RepID=A8AIE1_CITK8|nr:hypothetical protein CKO_02130 [Citrobacter koseri ATCC BAA-895]KWZ94470.1 hypothetical protein HMPREF3220_04700 [Citrobacter koseri]KXB39756.1 hypothetical protein HMPREF0208_04583 [Citrobacter koseri]